MGSYLPAAPELPEDRPPQYSGPSYAQPALAPGQPSMLEQASNVAVGAGRGLAEGIPAAVETAGTALQGPKLPLPTWEDPLAPARGLGQHIVEHPASVLPLGIYSEAQQAATKPIGIRAVEAAGGGTEPLFRATIPESVPLVGGAEIAPSAQDIGGFATSAALDPLNFVGAAGAGLAGKGARAVVTEAAKGLPLIGEADALLRGGAGLVRRGVGAASDALAANARQVAAADARLAAAGSTMAPASFGALPEPGGARRGLPTVEVLQEQIDTATAAWRRATEAGDDQMAAIARERAVELQSDLADARNARLDLEPAIRSDVGRQANPLTLTEESADDLSDAMRAREAVRAVPSDLSGPVGVPVDMSGRANASAGALPSTRGADPFAVATRVIAEPLAGSVGGATIGGGLPAETEEERRANTLRGAALGAVGFPIATRAARGAARLAGAGPSPGGGAAATLGAMPDDVRRAGRRARIAARGALPELPEGALPIRATPADEVSRLRLDMFPADVRTDIQAAAEGTDFARTQRRGVLPDEVVARMADDDTASVDQLIKGGRMGRAYNPEETVALRNAVASQANVVRDLSAQIAEARTSGATPDLLIARRAAESTKLQALVQVAEGARAEAGRTLRQYAQQAKLIELAPDEAIARIRKKIDDPDEFAAIVDEYTQAVNDGADPIVMAKLWSKVERGEIKASDVFALYRRFSMLSGPRTFEVNAISGALNLAYEVGSQAVGQAGRRRGGEMAAEVAAPLKAAGRAFKNMAETMWHGVSAEQAARGDIPRNLSARTDNPAAKKALTVMEIPDRFNAGVDQFFRTMTEDWAATIMAHKQARAAGLKPSSPEWAETVAQNLDAIRENPVQLPEVKRLADRVTFSDEPGSLGQGLEGIRTKGPGAAFASNLVMPFIRTPYNIASRAVDISPLGPVRTAVEAATGLGRGRANLSERARDHLVGTAATVWAYNQAQAGNLTGAGPDDPEKRAQLRAMGWQPYSIKIGDRYWSYANFAPFNLALSGGAAAAEAQKYAKPGKEDTASMLADGAKRAAMVVTDMTVLAGIGAIAKGIDDPDRYGTQWLSQFMQTLIPAGSLVNTLGSSGIPGVLDPDPLVRRAEREAFLPQVAQSVAARVPILRETVPAAQDPLGRAIPNELTGSAGL